MVCGAARERSGGVGAALDETRRVRRALGSRRVPPTAVSRGDSKKREEEMRDDDESGECDVPKTYTPTMRQYWRGVTQPRCTDAARLRGHVW